MRKKSKAATPSVHDYKVLWATIDGLRGPLKLSEYKEIVLGLLYLKALSQVEAHPSLWLGLIEGPAITLPVRFCSSIRQAFDADQGDFAADLSKMQPDPALLYELVTVLDEWLEARGSTCMADLFRYCFEKFSQAEHKSSSEQYSPAWLGKIFSQVLQPVNGLIYDPCCGSGSLLIRAWYEMQRETGGLPTVKFLGHESSLDAWRIAQMNLTIHGIPGRDKIQQTDSLSMDTFPDGRANYIMANPPFNQENWRRGDAHHFPWKHGEPPAHNANFAWIQHIIQHLAPDGYAAFTMSNGSLTSTQSGEGDIRKRLVHADLIDCIIALPGNLFPASRNPACLWILAQNKGMARTPSEPVRERHRKILFIDAQQLGHMSDRVHRVLDDADVSRIAKTYRSWRAAEKQEYVDVPGFCKVCDIQQVEAQDFILSPGRYVGVPRELSNPNNVRTSLAELTRKLEEQFMESNRLEQLIRERMNPIEV